MECFHQATHHRSTKRNRHPGEPCGPEGKLWERKPGTVPDAPSVPPPPPTAPTGAADLLKSAQEIVNGDRQRDYGHPAENHACTARLWAAYIYRRATANNVDYSFTFTSEDVCALNILQKISRLANTPTHTDSLRDIIGYALNWQMILDRASEKRAGEENAPLHLQGGATAEPCNGGSGCSASVSEEHHA
jgi:hypothetical protein